MLLGLAALWGASFMFIKVAVRELSPATLIVGRLGLAAITLGLLVPFVVGTRETARQLPRRFPGTLRHPRVTPALPGWFPGQNGERGDA